jgi:hypothetical protein
LELIERGKAGNGLEGNDDGLREGAHHLYLQDNVVPIDFAAFHIGN